VVLEWRRAFSTEEPQCKEVDSMLRLIVTLCIAAAAAAPAAVALHGPDDYAPKRPLVVPTFSVRDELDARLGPKYVSQRRPFAPAPPAVATPGDAPSGFPFAGLLIALGGVLLVFAVATRRRARSGWLSSRRGRQVET
jgi:hypothetical protein